jgi:hypothetical protein
MPITPVEASRTSSAAQSSACAAASAVAAAAPSPAALLQTLALPAFTTSARALPAGRSRRHQSTGWPGVSERVNRPATLVPGSNASSARSSRPL